MADTTTQVKSNQIIVTFDDVSVMAQVKKAITLMKGVKSVSAPRVRRKKTGIDKALDDVKHGRVYKAKSANDLIKQILGDNYVQG